ncbi:hypothetical protein [Algoriphagus jejuensis]
MPTIKTTHHLSSLVLIGVAMFLSYGCNSLSGGEQCQERKEFKDFEAMVKSFDVLSSKQDCFRLQAAATKLLANSKGCADELEIIATASPWKSFNCDDWHDWND